MTLIATHAVGVLTWKSQSRHKVVFTDTHDSLFRRRSLFNSQDRLQRNTQWPRPEHRNLSGVEMCRKCRPGRETGLGEAYSAVLKCTLQRMVRSDCSEDVVTGAQPDSVANNKISNQSNNKGCHSLLRPLTSRA